MKAADLREFRIKFLTQQIMGALEAEATKISSFDDLPAAFARSQQNVCELLDAEIDEAREEFDQDALILLSSLRDLAGDAQLSQSRAKKIIARQKRLLLKSGLFDGQGRAILPSTRAGSQIVDTVREANETLLKALRKKPELINSITDRQFEEVAAEIFYRLGYQVELTPAKKDGGKDLVLAKKADLGSFLYYVECKKYAEGRPVGVKVVRELYGLVESDRVTGGIILTSSYFTKGAKEFQETVNYRLSLQDYNALKVYIQNINI